MINITQKKDCCGCSACFNICGHHAIDFTEDKEGFLYPSVNSSLCVNCGLCEQVCPVIYRNNIELTPNQISYNALRIKDRELLQKSSSGGAFIAIAAYIINSGGVVCGAMYNDNCEVVHSFAETMNDTKKIMGSKYSQSRLSLTFPQIKQYLKTNRIVLFTGTPCQVEGLKLYLRKPYENLVTLDLVCHAVPSPKIFREYISFCSQKLNGHIYAIDMRNKEPHGWSHLFSYRYRLSDGKDITDPISISNWGKLFFSKLIDRPSCHDCKFTNYHRAGDITIADFWDDKGNRPDIKSKEGTSLCLVNTEKGMDILNCLKSNLELYTITKEESWQPCLQYSTEAISQRNLFWEYYEQNGFTAAYNKYFRESNYIRLKKYIKRFLATIHNKKA